MSNLLVSGILAATVALCLQQDPAARFKDYRLSGAKVSPVVTVPHELDVLLKAGHIQGLACSPKAIYLSHAKGIEKIGWDGRHLASIPATGHIGDIAYADGRLYGGNARQRWTDKDGKPRTGSVLRVWDEDLKPLAEKKFPDAAFDGCVVLNGIVYVGIDRWGGNPPHPDCCIKRLDLDLNDLGDTDIPLPFDIRYGVQTMATDGQSILLGCYGGVACVSPDLKTVSGRIASFGCSEGIAAVPAAWTEGRNRLFAVVQAMGGNMQGWRKDPVNNPPQIRLAFFAWDPAGKRMSGVTAK